MPLAAPVTVEKWKAYLEPVNPLEAGATHLQQSPIFQVLAFYCDYTPHTCQWRR